MHYTTLNPTTPYASATTPRPETRVGDPERERVANLLGAAFSLGYLSVDEYESRLRQAFDSPTAGAMSQILTDLPVDEIKRRDPRRRAARAAAARRGVRVHVGLFLAMALLCIGIWAAVAVTAGAWYFWPIWPILGGGIGVVSHAIPVQRCAERGWNLGLAEIVDSSTVA